MARQIDRVCYAQTYVSLEQPRTALDVGSHDAFVTRTLAADNECLERVVCVDPCQAAMIQARAQLVGTPYKHKFFLLELPWDEYDRKCKSYFDLVLCFEVIEHFELFEACSILNFLHSRANPEGRVCISTPDRVGPWGEANEEREHITLFDAEQLLTTVKTAVGVTPDIVEQNGLLLATWVKQ